MITGKQFRDMIISGANNISNHKAEVDRLNVFPVPDGDTGTNMSMTIGYAVGELENLPDDVRIDRVASVAASALLKGARGNSGVILSLMFRGFSRGMQGKARADSACITESLRIGVDAAYKAIMKPTEGTMLTVARVAVERAIVKTGDLDVTALLEYIIDVEKETLEKTPEMLPILKKAGVVDAGGKGLIIIFEGMLTALKDGAVITVAAGTTSESEPVDIGVYAEGIGEAMTDEYCTEFLVVKHASADAMALRKELEAVGNSVLCVDDDDIIKCHIHTETPDQAISSALKHGHLSRIKIENMLEQYMRLQADAKAQIHNEDYEKSSEIFEYMPIDEDEPYGFVAVSAGKGLKTLFENLGVNRTVEGGQSMNPSTEDILAAVHSVPAQNVFVLVNNKNIILAAEQAANLADRAVIVIPTRSVPQGVSAMLAFDPSMSIENNTIEMRDAADSVKSGSITWAARDSNFDGKDIKEGEILALENGRLLFSDTDISKATVKLARRLIDKDTCFVTLIYGEGVSAAEANAVFEQIQNRAKNIEVSLVNGGQPVYYYYVAVE